MGFQAVGLDSAFIALKFIQYDVFAAGAGIVEEVNKARMCGDYCPDISLPASLAAVVIRFYQYLVIRLVAAEEPILLDGLPHGLV